MRNEKRTLFEFLNEVATNNEPGKLFEIPKHLKRHIKDIPKLVSKIKNKPKLLFTELTEYDYDNPQT